MGRRGSDEGKETGKAMSNPTDNATRATSPAMIALLGILAYVGETLTHEAVGHGGICLLSGGRIALLAPLYMHCSIVTLPMIAAGPAANVLAGVLFLVVLRSGRQRSATFRYFLWLS